MTNKERIAALEARVAALEAALAPKATEPMLGPEFLTSMVDSVSNLIGAVKKSNS
ncbi:hypothetical protein SEA_BRUTONGASTER_116 [Gordonia phage BrutonGaster]|uniref:Uncharacterized protein n=1 Tax=Gordonia phage BrutonGaster TaxID=2530116 RepID=A0A482JHT5_9CAUD|nr:hypothetical protein HOV26_gp066 [Gordonia phage BrutonGaster]QBP33331.1 hypothetical protein SEA_BRUTONGASTER_116 [Gordonia phage BrutonGaster]